jgi:hypothetical protein
MGKYAKNGRKNLLATGFGVAVIFLLLILGRHFALEKPVDESEAAELAEQTELNMQQMQGQLADKLGGNIASEEQTRLESPAGQAMLRQCLEWTALFESLPDDTNRQNRDLACEKHRNYVASGILPE